MAVKFQDYYQTLGVPRDATPEQIQRAYRKLARQYHPDVNKDKDAEPRFKQIGEAYEVLKDPEKRQKYDALGADWKAGQEFTPPGYEDMHFDFGDRAGRGGFSFRPGGDFSDFFETFFGQRGPGGASGFEDVLHRAGHARRNPGPAEGRDAQSDIHITLEEAFHGSNRQLSLQLPDGSQRTLDVKIPAGARDGSVIRLRGQGSPGSHGGASGDLLLTVHIAPHDRFETDGHDLATTLDISPWEAALGARLAVATLDGDVTLTIPPASQSGQKLRLRHRGLPRRGGERGDLLVRLRIVVPKHLTDSERTLLEQLRDTSTFNPRQP